MKVRLASRYLDLAATLVLSASRVLCCRAACLVSRTCPVSGLERRTHDVLHPWIHPRAAHAQHVIPCVTIVVGPEAECSLCVRCLAKQGWPSLPVHPHAAGVPMLRASSLPPGKSDALCPVTSAQSRARCRGRPMCLGPGSCSLTSDGIRILSNPDGSERFDFASDAMYAMPSAVSCTSATRPATCTGTCACGQLRARCQSSTPAANPPPRPNDH